MRSRYRPRTPLPRQPDLARGRCATAPEHLKHLWTSATTADREAARQLCLTCPVLLQCREYALSLPVTDTATYAALSWKERITARRAAKPLASAS